MDELKLGDRVRDRISGFSGIASGRAMYLNGCTRIQVDGVDKDGQPKGWWFDAVQLELVEAGAYFTPKTQPSSGGPRGDEHPRAADPSR